MYRLTETALEYLREQTRGPFNQRHRRQKYCPVCDATTTHARAWITKLSLGLTIDAQSACLQCGWLHVTETVTDKAKRERIFALDNHECVYCGSGSQLTLDHIIPQARGGSHDVDNLVTACNPCNCRRGAARVEMVPRYGRFTPKERP